MWKKTVSMALDLVAQIEYELKGKTGPEKKKLVIERLVKAIDIPFVPDSLETPILHKHMDDIQKFCHVVSTLHQHSKVFLQGIGKSDVKHWLPQANLSSFHLRYYRFY
jgi:hypothetical protein